MTPVCPALTPPCEADQPVFLKEPQSRHHIGRANVTVLLEIGRRKGLSALEHGDDLDHLSLVRVREHRLFLGLEDVDGHAVALLAWITRALKNTHCSISSQGGRPNSAAFALTATEESCQLPAISSCASHRSWFNHTKGLGMNAPLSFAHSSERFAAWREERTRSAMESHPLSRHFFSHC